MIRVGKFGGAAVMRAVNHVVFSSGCQDAGYKLLMCLPRWLLPYDQGSIVVVWTAGRLSSGKGEGGREEWHDAKGKEKTFARIDTLA